MRVKYKKVNAAFCRTCGKLLVSIHRHDFAICPCGQFVDGGFDYIRRTLDLIDAPLYWKETK